MFNKLWVIESDICGIFSCYFDVEFYLSLLTVIGKLTNTKKIMLLNLKQIFKCYEYLMNGIFSLNLKYINIYTNINITHV